MKFQMIKYGKKEYPLNIPLHMQEVAGHFDVKSIRIDKPFCLHTEYSYGERAFSNPSIKSSGVIKANHNKGVPQLWHSVEWAIEFAEYIINLTQNSPNLKCVEIHPPFKDYCPTIEEFISRYRLFEKKLVAAFPDIKIFIENRCGSVYGGGRFLVSDAESLKELTDHISSNCLRLRIALDIPQFFTAYNFKESDIPKMTDCLSKLKPIINHVASIHLWGKKQSNSERRIAHCGDLSTYFYNDKTAKEKFLQDFKTVFEDGIKRYLLLEVNSTNNDLHSIISDLDSIGAIFI